MASRICIAILTFALGLGGCCGSLHHVVDGEQFVAMSQRFGSVECTQFLGVAGGRAYLLHWQGTPRSLGGGEDVYSCPVDELPDFVRTAIENGTPPWLPGQTLEPRRAPVR